MQHIKYGEVPVGDSEVQITDGASQCPSCDGFTDLFCVAIHACWEQIGQGLIALAIVIVILYCVACKCVPCRLINCCINRASACGPTKQDREAARGKAGNQARTENRV